jgi:hypothetical protein
MKMEHSEIVSLILQDAGFQTCITESGYVAASLYKSASLSALSVKKVLESEANGISFDVKGIRDGYVLVKW